MSNSVPAVSIVLPTYNGEKYIEESIMSCLIQTFSNFELIIVDDGSTDRTSEIIESFAQKDSRIKIIHNGKNKKLPASLNIGFSQARGKYHTWTSDDNMYLPVALKGMFQFLENNENIDIVYCDYIKVNQETKQIKERRSVPNIEVINQKNAVGACFMYKSEIFSKLKGYDENLFCVEDYDFWLRAYRNNYRFTPLHQALYVYRVHNNSLSVQKENLITDMRSKLIANHLKELKISREQSTASCNVLLPDVKSSALPVQKTVAIWGWWQGKNLGDNWIKETLAGFLPNAVFIDTTVRNFEKYDFVICGGGGLFVRNVIPPWDGKINTAYGILGLGAEFPHTDKKAIELAKRAEFFYLRDEYSITCMGASKGFRSYDIVFANPLPKNNNPDFNTVFFVWRDTEKLLVYPDFREYIGDAGNYSMWKEKLSKEFTGIKEDNFNAEDCHIDEMLSDCGFVVSGRFHGIVAAIQKGIPCIAIDLCPKIRSLMREVGLEEYCLKPGETGALRYKIKLAKEKYSEIKFKQAEYCKIARKVVTDHIRSSIVLINNRFQERGVNKVSHCNVEMKESRIPAVV
jgi:glycosyltransferase involved in cell wall biosynthesis